MEECISDTAIHKGVQAWVKARLVHMLGAEAAPLIQGPLRFVGVDGSTVQGPGASGPWYRLHLAVDLVKLHLIDAEVSDKPQGEHLDYSPR